MTYKGEGDTPRALRILAMLRQWHYDNIDESDPFYPTDEVMYEGSGADHAEFFYTLLEEALR